jgi:hypothetical protein
MMKASLSYHSLWLLANGLRLILIRQIPLFICGIVVESSLPAAGRDLAVAGVAPLINYGFCT